MPQHDLGALAQQPALQTEEDQSPEAVEVRKSKWLDFFQKPEMQAALLQFGISALQPKAPGQTTTGAVTASIGEGAEAAGRVTAQRQAGEQQTAENLLAERRVGAVEAQAETGKSRLGLEETRINNQASQFIKTLEQNLGIARNSAMSKMATSLMVEEIKNADLDGRAPNFAGITQQVVAMQAALRSGKAPTVRKVPESPEEIAAELGKLSVEEQEKKIAAAEKSGKASPEDIAAIREILGTSVEKALEEPKAESNVGALKELERGLRVKVIGDPKLRKEEEERGALAADDASRTLQGLFPGGLDDITEEELDVLRRGPELAKALEAAFPRKKPTQSNISWLRAKFATEKKARRGAR